MAGVIAEKQLAAYLDYLHHVSSAIIALPTFVGRVFRGTRRKTEPCPPTRTHLALMFSAQASTSS